MKPDTFCPIRGETKTEKKINDVLGSVPKRKILVFMSLSTMKRD